MISGVDYKMTPQSTFSMPIEAVATLPFPGMIAPGVFAFSPNDDFITFLYSPDHNLIRQLYRFEPKTKEYLPLLDVPEKEISEEKLSIEEALRRERQRQMNLGITHYEWASRKNNILIPLADGIYILNESGGSLHKIINNLPEPPLDPRFSPNGEWISFIRDAELFIVPSSGGQPPLPR